MTKIGSSDNGNWFSKIKESIGINKSSKAKAPAEASASKFAKEATAATEDSLQSVAFSEDDTAGKPLSELKKELEDVNKELEKLENISLKGMSAEDKKAHKEAIAKLKEQRREIILGLIPSLMGNVGDVTKNVFEGIHDPFKSASEPETVEETIQATVAETIENVMSTINELLSNPSSALDSVPKNPTELSSELAKIPNLLQDGMDKINDLIKDPLSGLDSLPGVNDIKTPNLPSLPGLPDMGELLDTTWEILKDPTSFLPLIPDNSLIPGIEDIEVPEFVQDAANAIQEKASEFQNFISGIFG